MNRRLIVLDDEPGVLDAYRIILNPAPTITITSSRSRAATAPAAFAPQVATNFEVSYFTTGEEALEAIERGVKEKQPFVGGFFDVKLGTGIDGLETIRRAKSIDQEILCVTVSAYQDRSIDEISKIFGEFYADRWDFITKPFTQNEILQKARNLTYNWDRRRREKEYLDKIKNQQDLLIRQERLAAMGTLARGIGHEFGNILLRIIGKAEIAKGKNDPKEMLEALTVIASAAERAGHIVRNLQSLVKMETTRDSGNIHDPIKDSIELIEHELKKASVNVVTQLTDTLPEILMNRIELSQVFLNLFINAKHAMEPNGGDLKIRTFRDYDSLCVEVSDTGAGITPENMAHLFEPLFTTKGEKGTGIGLSVSKKIIENHNGRITVNSAFGRGTTFKITLPFKQEKK